MKRLWFLVPPALSIAFIINLCSLIYRCGCQSWWSGAAVSCNIHDAEAKHCPWCSHGDLGFGTVLVLVLIPQVVLSFVPVRWDWRIRLLAALLAFPAIGSLAALGFGWVDGYWGS